jgi:DNA-binding transcriptional ArsR family regulator
MIAEADIAAVGALIGDRARASMLNALMGGEAISAGELARVGGVSPSGATAHLRRLRQGGLIVGEAAGRQRVFRLASPELAEALEALALVAPPVPVRGLRASKEAGALKRARTCYDHLAGELGVAVADALVEREILTRDDGGFAVTRAGRQWLQDLGLDLDALLRARRSFARGCVDWTERRPHVAGSLGAGITAAFFARGWVRRRPGGRAIAVTRAGAGWLNDSLGIRLDVEARRSTPR